MAGVSVRIAEDAGDFEVARALCREWLDWHWKNYPSDWPIWAGHPMERTNFEAVLQELPALHARPRGAVLIGAVEGQDAGCVMYQEAADGVAEFKRMFVSERGRGHGLGRTLLEEMFQRMIADGYLRVIFSSATFLTHARAMYESVGFTGMPHPPGFPDGLRERVYFMERTLV